MTRPSSPAASSRRGWGARAKPSRPWTARPMPWAPRCASSPTAPAPIGLGGVMGGASTGCSETTTEVFIESAWFDPIRTAQTGRDTGIASDAQYRFARGVDPGFVVPGLELATRLILELCGGEASEVVSPARRPRRPPRSPSTRPMWRGSPAWTVAAARSLGDSPRPRLRSRGRAAFSRRPGGAMSRARPTWSRRWPASPATAPCPRRRCRKRRGRPAAC